MRGATIMMGRAEAGVGTCTARFEVFHESVADQLEISSRFPTSAARLSTVRDEMTGGEDFAGVLNLGGYYSNVSADICLGLLMDRFWASGRGHGSCGLIPEASSQARDGVLLASVKFDAAGEFIPFDVFLHSMDRPSSPPTSSGAGPGHP